MKLIFEVNLVFHEKRTKIYRERQLLVMFYEYVLTPLPLYGLVIFIIDYPTLQLIII